MQQPIDLLAGDQPTQCPYDGIRLEIYAETLPDGIEAGEGYTVEYCPCCSKFFNVWEE